MALSQVELKATLAQRCGAAIIRNPLVVTPDTGLWEAIAQMQQADPDGAPGRGTQGDTHRTARAACAVVVETGRVVGLLSQQDIFQAICQRQAADASAAPTVGAIMQPSVTPLAESDCTDARAIAEAMDQQPCRCLPLINDQGELAGLITQDTLQAAFGGEEPPATSESGALAARVAQLEAEKESLQQELQARRHIESLLLESEQRYASLATAAPVGIYRIDDAGQCIYVNDYYCQITGLPLEAAMGAGWQQAIHPEDRDRVLRTWETCLQESYLCALEYRYLQADGAVVWVYSQTTLERGAGGATMGYVGTITDISDRKRAELALQQSESTNRIIIDTIPDLLIQMDLNGRYGFMLGGKGVWVQYPSPHADQPEVYTVLPPELAERRLFYARRAVETNRLQIYEQVLDIGQTQRYEEIRITPVNDQEVLIIIRDITSRKQAERQLQNLMEATAATIGQDFFPAFVIHITEALQVSHAIVAELLGDRIRTLAFWADNALQSPYAHDLGQTPYERVVTEGVFYCEEGIQAQFPEDLFLADMAAESCLGIALHDSRGEVIGLLCVFNRHPIQDPQRAEELLQVFAARAAAELERQRASTSLERLNQRLEAEVEERTARLREREQFLRTVLDTFPIAVFWKDLNCVYRGCNSNFLRHAGLASNSDIIDKTDYDLPWADTEADAYRADDRLVMTTGIPKLSIVETQHQANGNCVWLETNKLPLYNLTGKIVGVLGTYQDITERMQAEVGLRESEERYRSIFDQAAVGIANTAADGRLIAVNPCFCQMLGYTQAELLSLTVTDVTHPKDIRRISPAQRRLFAGEIPHFSQEKRYVRKDGSYFWSSTNVSLVRTVDGSPKHALAIIRDISERKQAEAQVSALLHRTQLLNLISTEIRDSLDLDVILQNSVDAIFTGLAADSCTFTWCKMGPTGTHWEIVKEQKSEDLPSWRHSYRDNAFPLLFEHVLHNRLYRIDAVEALADNALKEFLQGIGIQAFLCLPIHTVGGKVGSLQIGRISSERPWRKDEIELLQDIGNQVAIAIYQAQLYEESQAKTTEIERSYQELKETQLQLIQSEKMSSLGQLVAGIAHEINNPMSFIYGNLDVASRYAADLSQLITAYRSAYPHPPPEISDLAAQLDIDYALNDFPQLLASMETGATRIRDIVKSLRMFSRLDRAEYKAVDIHENIENTLVILQNRLNGRAGKPEIQVVKRYGDIPEIECYGSLLNQVFMNLLANGIDAIEERQGQEPEDYSGCITITTAISAEAPHSKIFVGFQDNGVGMTADTVAKIFDPFFTTKPVGVGTGMGLPISYQIVTSRHRGQLQCKSTLGQGTRFTVELWQTL